MGNLGDVPAPDPRDREAVNLAAGAARAEIAMRAAGRHLAAETATAS